MISAFLQGDLLWREPLWLWALLLPIIFWVVKRSLRNQQKQHYADAALWPWVATVANNTSNNEQINRKNQFTRPGKSLQAKWQDFFIRLIKFITAGRLFILAWLCLVIALAGPRSLDNQFETHNRHGVDVMIDFDLSQSMTSTDVKPNRFLYAKSLAQSLVLNLENNDRIGLSVFAGQPHTVLPFTYDKPIFNHFLNLIEPGLLPTKGSWLQLGLIGALNNITQTGRGAKVLVVFTNGAPPFWKPVALPKIVQSLKVTQSQKQSQTGVKVIFVGVGNTRPSPIPDNKHESGHLHVNGLLVQSRLEESQLLKLAQQTEGVYLRASSDQAFMSKLVKEITDQASNYQDKSLKQVWISYEQPFLIVGLIALLLAFYLWQVLLGLKPGSVKRSNSANFVLIMMLPIMSAMILSAMTLWSQPAMADESLHSGSSSLHQAYRDFEAQSYDSAQALYDKSATYQGWFGAGASAYKAKDLDSAVLYFRQAAWQAPNNKERAKSLYNLGNSYYLANLLPQAIESYEQALLYQPTYPKAQHNLGLAKQRYVLEKQAKKVKPTEKKKNTGGQGKNADGAFYGGQKPKSDSKDPGFGSDGDSPEGNGSGKMFTLPEADKLTNYKLNPSIAKLRLNSVQKSGQNKVLQAQVNQQRAEKFEHQLQSLQDDQKQVLKRVFEREEGFEAAQKEAHAIPGIQPW
ncbi:VWA domain-containing protein [Thiomicrorhabdus hydrogeniphila]